MDRTVFVFKDLIIYNISLSPYIQWVSMDYGSLTPIS